jgi:hypothetical protein
VNDVTFLKMQESANAQILRKSAFEPNKIANSFINASTNQTANKNFNQPYADSSVVIRNATDSNVEHIKDIDEI